MSQFWYDRVGRLAISQNARQRHSSATEADRYYSYTKYDGLGRIVEVGQVRNTLDNRPITDARARNADSLNLFLTTLNTRRGPYITTMYDIKAVPTDPASQISQNNLRNRVSYMYYADTGTISTYANAMYYSYDILGNVDTLLHDYGPSGGASVQNMMNQNMNRFKKIAYKYDLVSGKVNMVIYQRGFSDQWLHRYNYDAENRLTLVETSRDSLVWEKDARYDYYRHGPLARVTIGGQQVQGTDYAYTLQGWLKGINSTGGSIGHDMGEDGKGGSANQHVATDAIGLTLNYFAGDFSGIGGTEPFPGYSAKLGSAYRPLYNGNISSLSIHQKKFAASDPLIFYNYRYDQLNRLIAQDAYHGFDTATNSWSSPLASMGEKLKERISYDANGNILTYLRKSLAGGNMDNLQYHYYPNTNRLKYIDDQVDDNIYTDPVITDIERQSDNNYLYDSIGNLIMDNAEKINNIRWDVFGKIVSIEKAATDQAPATRIDYEYDVLGNRIGQNVAVPQQGGGTMRYLTWYVRDAQGNILSTYTGQTTGNYGALDLHQDERFVYGSSRLGSYGLKHSVDGGPALLAGVTTDSFARGYMQYELTNHLGNVLATVSDKKFGVSSEGSLIDHYEPDIVNATDYYPFGMPSRVSLTGKGYRFGFNGKENDNDVKGWGNQQDYGMRVYDPRVGRFLSVDPLQKQFPDLTPYQFAGNTPIQAIDLDGLEPRGFMEYWKAEKEYPTKWGYTVQDVYDYKTDQTWTVMHYPNTNEYYYWETKYEGANRLFVPHNTALNRYENQWTGKFKQFRPAHLSEDRSFHYAMVGMLTAPFVAMGAIEGVAALAYGIEAQALTTIGNALLKYWYHAPAIGKAGMNVAEFLDESGSVGMQNTAVKKIAFGFERNARKLATDIGGDHLMDFKGDWKQEFLNIINDATQEIHFSLDDLEGSLYSNIMDFGRSSTNWKLNTLYQNKEAFNRTIFHYGDKTYKGEEVFNLEID